MDKIAHLKLFKESYEKSFLTDWIEDLSWTNLKEAAASCDEGRRCILNFKKETFINISKSLLEGEYINSENEINTLHKEMLNHWEQEHYALDESNRQIYSLKTRLMSEYEALDSELRYLFNQIGLLEVV